MVNKMIRLEDDADRTTIPKETVNLAEKLVEQVAADPGAAFEPQWLAFLTELKRQEPASYERVRSKLKKSGVRVGELDKLIGRSEHVEREIASGSALEWPEDDPWPEEVIGADLLDEVSDGIAHYLVVSKHEANTMALWAAFAHALDAFVISPRLAFVSPEKRCGKTTALSITQQLVPKALPASNISPSAVFRSIEMAQPTLLIDEADTFLNAGDELRGILNSGHNRHQAYVVRVTGDDHIPARFCTWSPVAIAMIGRLPDTLQDRSIVIELRRKKPSDNVERFRMDRVAGLEVLCRKLARWTTDSLAQLRAWDGSVPESLHDRAADNWRSLIAIADSAGGQWPEKARGAAIALSQGEADDDSAAVMLLTDIQQLFHESGAEKLSTTGILERLNDMDERPWPEWKKGKPLTARQLARLLQRFGISPSTIRLPGSGTAKGYALASMQDTFSRYTPSQSVTPSQPALSNGYSQILSVTSESNVTDRKPLKPALTGTCDGVTDRTPPLEEKGAPGQESDEVGGLI
jgi:putative DNA primase/helicase